MEGGYKQAYSGLALVVGWPGDSVLGEGVESNS